MIIGIGTDVVQIPRIERILKQYQIKFATKILHELELNKMTKLDSSLYAKFLAKRFAAKEAISKAMGVGIGADIGFQDIIITNDKKGKPVVLVVNNTILEHYDVYLSISDDYPIAVAFAIISSKSNK